MGHVQDDCIFDMFGATLSHVLGDGLGDLVCVIYGR